MMRMRMMRVMRMMMVVLVVIVVEGFRSQCSGCWLNCAGFMEKPVNPQSDESKSLRKYAQLMRPFPRLVLTTAIFIIWIFIIGFALLDFNPFYLRSRPFRHAHCCARAWRSVLWDHQSSFLGCKLVGIPKHFEVWMNIYFVIFCCCILASLSHSPGSEGFATTGTSGWPVCLANGARSLIGGCQGPSLLESFG